MLLPTLRGCTRDVVMPFSQREVRVAGSGAGGYARLSGAGQITEARLPAHPCHARGLDILSVGCRFLDLVPTGRDVQVLPFTMA